MKQVALAGLLSMSFISVCALIILLLAPTPHVAPLVREVVITPQPNQTQEALLRKVATSTAGMPTVLAIYQEQATKEASDRLATWAASPHGSPRGGI